MGEDSLCAWKLRAETEHWVPVDQAVEAQAHGGRFVQNNGKEYASGTEPVITGVNAAGQPMWGSGPKYLGRDASGMPLYDRQIEPAGPVSRFLSSAGSAIGGAIKGIPAMFDPRANEFEQRIGHGTRRLPLPVVRSRGCWNRR